MRSSAALSQVADLNTAGNFFDLDDKNAAGTALTTAIL